MNNIPIAMKSFIAEFPSLVREMIVVKIDDEELTNASFQYSILNHEKKVCRKGHFTGLLIQLRVSHLQDGKYHFYLTTDSRTPTEYTFEKKSKHSSEIVEFDFS